MTKKIFWSLFALTILTITITACSVLSEPAAPSGELEAAPVEVDAPAAEVAPTEVAAAEDVEEVSVEDAPLEDAPVEESAAPLIYQIDPAASQVRFELDEVLRGNPITVVGLTDQVAGQISADLKDLSTVKAGEIRINARTLATDNDFRNRALKNEILDTGDFEFITFLPTAVNGLPDSAAVGDTLQFTIDGDLTIRDITLPVTFTVTASPVSETQLSGSATTTIAREDFNLTIPTVPNVADVEEEVELYIDFVANAS